MPIKVLIGLSTAEYIRKANFLPAFLALEKPAGTLMTTIHGQSPAAARNSIIDQALKNGCTHIFFLDDDTIPPPDALIKLLSHDKDIVTGLYLMRGYPHWPVVFDEAYDDGFNKHLFLTEEKEGLIKITNCGLGCVVIKTEVFKNLEPPYVRLGEIVKDGWSDDVGFFNRAREAGFELWCDLDVRAGHLTELVVHPTKIEDKWFTEYRHPNGNILIPQMSPTEEEKQKKKEAVR